MIIGQAGKINRDQSNRSATLLTLTSHKDVKLHRCGDGSSETRMSAQTSLTNSADTSDIELCSFLAQIPKHSGILPKSN